MRRALLAGLALGVVAGLLFVFHDALRLSVSWPALFGFALWATIGRRGARGGFTAIAAVIGVAFGYATFAVSTEFFPLTEWAFGVVAGVAVGILAAAGLVFRERLPMPALMVGYATFLGVFEPRWVESPASIRTHGLEDLTVALLGLLVGILAVTVARALVDGWADRHARSEEMTKVESPVPGSVAMKGSAS